MNHLERALDGQNQWWKPIVVFLGIIGSSLIIQMLFLVVLMLSGAVPIDSQMEANLNKLLMSNQYVMFPFIFISSAVLVLIGVIFIKVFHKWNFKEVINGTSGFRWKKLFYSMSIWAALMAFYLSISYISNPDGFKVVFDIKNFIPLIFLSIIAIPIQAGSEEFLFRGYLAQILGGWTKSRWVALIIPAIIFGLVHSFNPEIEKFGFWVMMPNYIFLGLVFGFVSILDDGIETAMGAHIGNNIFMCLFLTFDGSVLQTSAIFHVLHINPIVDFISTILMGIVFVIILKQKYKWNYSRINLKIEKKEVETNIDLV